MWSSRTCEPYMCITIHYILDWKIKSACLQTTYFPQDHTGENIAQALRDVTTTWMLNPNGPVAITTDNGANIVCAVQKNNWQMMQCFGHRLHLAIGHGMQDPRITRAISLCKKTVSTFSYSWKKRRELAEVQAQMNLPAHQLKPSTSDLLDIASFIDPRFRGKYVSSGKLVALKERVICEAQSLLGDQGSSAGVDKAVPQSAQESAIADPVPPIAKKKKTLLFFIHTSRVH
ncbi:Zinc finger BED domain-containing protein 6 [Anabarilius grahami]|uniref:Zinc finger BED domain-containing protein 6 n=1 Tax=Anabarilius grahami TaxID=495550 RepID=A0A3N0YXA0_ANAGA|nr:Zinc finger BED domain-containing protein 6 [Anabarilius grahami]